MFEIFWVGLLLTLFTSAIMNIVMVLYIFFGKHTVVVTQTNDLLVSKELMDAAVKSAVEDYLAEREEGL